MKPIIGIILRDETKRKMSINKEVMACISNLGGIPIGIYPANLEDVIKMCNGFILQGGDDFTEFDLELIKIVCKLNIPLLGICLGMQTMGYLFDGKMDKCLNHHSNEDYVHEIKIIKNSLLYKILNKETILVNSRHHDCIIKTDLDISAISSDGIIEAVENRNYKYFLGVQWHPETLCDDNSNLIFKSFIEACKGGNL